MLQISTHILKASGSNCYPMLGKQLRFERLTWVHTETSVGWVDFTRQSSRRFDLVETKLAALAIILITPKILKQFVYTRMSFKYELWLVLIAIRCWALLSDVGTRIQAKHGLRPTKNCFWNSSKSPPQQTQARLKLSRSGPGPGPRSGPGQVPGQVQKVQGPRTKRPGPGLTLNLVCHPLATHHSPLTTHHPPNFSWADNHSKPLLNDF